MKISICTSRIATTIVLLLFVSVLASAQDIDSANQSTDDAPSAMRLRRQGLINTILGVNVLQIQGTQKFVDPNFIDQIYFQVAFGFGMHIPVFAFEKNMTLSVVPTVQFGNGFSDTKNTDDRMATSIQELHAQLYATYTLGGLPRKNSRWGFEIGIGADAAIGFTDVTSTTVVPSILFDVIYAPGNVVRLCFIADVIKREMSNGQSYQRFGIQFCTSVKSFNVL